MREYKREIMERFEPIFNQDVQMIRSVPRELCRVDVQNKFIGAKRNLINRRIQTMISAKLLSDWTPKRKICWLILFLIESLIN